MKKPSFLLVVLVPIAAATYGQKLPDSLRLNNDQLKILLPRYSQGVARYSHATVRGKVYQMPADNMPCLVPATNSTAAMPNGFKGGNVDEKMNVWPGRAPMTKEEALRLRDSLNQFRSPLPGNR